MSVLLHPASSVFQSSEAVIGTVRQTVKDRTHANTDPTHTHTPALQHIPLGLKTGKV